MPSILMKPLLFLESRPSQGLLDFGLPFTVKSGFFLQNLILPFGLFSL